MFTYKDYYELVTAMTTGSKLYLRHDVDISLKKAVELAERETVMGIGPAVYFIQFTSPHYNPFALDDKRQIEQILNLGHSIGLHYDLSLMPDNDPDKSAIIIQQVALLSEEFQVDVTGISCHKPVMGEKPSIALLKALNMVNVNDPAFTLADYKYVSDSGMNFREDPMEVVKYSDKIHLNIHPEWWATEEGTFQERLMNLELDLVADRKINKEIKEIVEYRNAIKNEKTT